MKSHSIVVSDADMAGLSRLVKALRHPLFRDQLQLELLNQTLESAEVASSDRISKDTVKMNSRIHVLDLDTGKKELYKLVFPEHADIFTGHFRPRTSGDRSIRTSTARRHRSKSTWRDQAVTVERVLYRTGKRVRPRQAEKPSLARNIQTAGLAA
jgi:hypothetical protein